MYVHTVRVHSSSIGKVFLYAQKDRLVCMYFSVQSETSEAHEFRSERWVFDSYAKTNKNQRKIISVCREYGQMQYACVHTARCISTAHLKPSSQRVSAVYSD